MDTLLQQDFYQEDLSMAKMKKNPSKAGISAASVQGNAGPNNSPQEKGKHSTNQQYKKENTE